MPEYGFSALERENTSQRKTVFWLNLRKNTYYQVSVKFLVASCDSKCTLRALSNLRGPFHVYMRNNN